MGDRRSQDQRLRQWSEQFKEPPTAAEPVPERELEQFKADFYHALNHARKKVQRRPVVQLGWLRLAAGTALIIAACAVGLCLLQPKPVIAILPAEFQGQVINAFDSNPVPAVRVYKSNHGRVRNESDTFIDETDAFGMFTINPAVDGVGHYYLLLGEDLVGEKDIEPENESSYGTVDFVISVADFKRVESQKVELLPGMKKELSPSLSISLDSTAAQSWQGEVIKENKWPDVFNFGRIIDGVFKVAGPAEPNLKLHLTVTKRRLDELDADPGQMKVISFEHRYATRELQDQQRLLPTAGLSTSENPDPYDYADLCFFHRGWYRLDKPLCRLLETGDCAVQTAGEQTTVTWSVTPGKAYALALTPQLDGEVVACYKKSLDQPGSYSKTLMVLNLRRPVMGVYDVLYNDGKQIECITAQPQHRALEYSLAEKLGKLGLSTEGDLPLPDIPGTFIVRLYDFTLTDYVDYPPPKVDFPEAGQYDIVVQQGPVGGMTQLALEGDLSWLAEEPAWDFGSDYVNDKNGLTAELFTPYAGAYKVNVTLHQKNGAVVRLDRWVNLRAGRIAGFCSYSNICTPVLQTVAKKPDTVTKWLSMSEECIPNPLPYGYTASKTLGPVWLFTPPPDFCNTELRELRIEMYASPGGGDTNLEDCLTRADGTHIDTAMYLVPWVNVTAPVGDWMNGIPVFDKKELVPGHPNIVDIGLGDMSYWMNKRVGQLLGPEADPASGLNALLQIWMPNGKVSDACRLESFKLTLGFDPSKPPDAKEVKDRIRQFIESDYYPVCYVSEEKQKLQWKVKLYDYKLAAGNSYMVGISTETRGGLLNAQYMLYSGADLPASITLIAADGREHTQYLDFSLVDEAARLPYKGQ